MSVDSNPPSYLLLRLAPLALVLPIMYLVSSGTPAIAPVAVVSMVVAALVFERTALAANALHSHKGGWWDWLFVAAMGVAATHVLFAPGFPRGHDIITHLWGTYGFFQAILEGNLWPRWIHHIGLGMPFLLFYPSVPFYGMLPFMAAGFPVYDCFKYGFVLFSALSGISMFFVVRRWTGSRHAAILAALAYCFAPYHLCESNYRVAVAEACAMVSLPPFFYFMQRALQAPVRENIRWAALWTALLALSHPLSLVMGGTGMGLYVLAAHSFKFDKVLGKQLILLTALGVLGGALAGFYTVPVAVEGRYATITSSLGGKVPMYAGHGLYPTDLLERRAWTKWQKSEKHGDPERKNEMPYYFGLSLLALLPIARLRSNPALTRGMLGVTVGGLLLTLYPFDLLGYLPTFIVLQFPWRFLSIATCGAAIMVGFATLELQKLAEGRTWQRYVPSALAVLLLVDFFPYGGAPLWQKPYTGIYKYSENMGSGQPTVPVPFRVDMLQYPPADPHINVSLFRRAYPEYFTPATKSLLQRDKDVAKENAKLERIAVDLNFDKAPARPVVLTPAPYAEFTPEGGIPRALPFTRGGERITVELPGEAGTLVIKEQYFPGWESRLGNRDVKLEGDTEGLMRVSLSAQDSGKLELWFSRTTWDRLGGILLSLGTALVLFVPRGRKPEAPEPASSTPATPAEDKGDS